MKIILASLLLTLCGCGMDAPSTPSASNATKATDPAQAAAPTPTSAREDLPPSDPISGPHPAFDASLPGAGTYQFSTLDPTNLWIGGSKPGLAFSASIQLARLSFPFPSNPAPPGLRDEIANPIGNVIQRELAGGKFRFVPTFWGYQGVGQVGGVIYLPNGHTLQDVLLSQGLVRVNRDRSADFQSAALSQSLLDYWLKCEEAAKITKSGFWASHPELMWRNWDSTTH